MRICLGSAYSGLVAHQSLRDGINLRKSCQSVDGNLGLVVEIGRGSSYGVENCQLGDTSGAYNQSVCIGFLGEAAQKASGMSMASSIQLANGLPEPRSLAKLDSFSRPAFPVGGDIVRDYGRWECEWSPAGRFGG